MAIICRKLIAVEGRTRLATAAKVSPTLIGPYNDAPSKLTGGAGGNCGTTGATATGGATACGRATGSGRSGGNGGGLRFAYSSGSS